MKKLHLVLGIVLFTGIIFSACKKDDNNTSRTTTEKLQAKWNFQKEYYHEYDGTDYRDTTIGISGDYADFRTDGKVYLHIAGFGDDTASYSVIDDSKIVFVTPTGSGSSLNYDTATIQVLTDNSLQYHVKEPSNASINYYEYTDYFTK
jgi:hypothetical protein